MGHSSETKKASIPSWQRQEETQGKETIEETSDSSHGNSSDASSQDDLLEKASRFLDEDGIRDAPKERKVSFLEGKGLTREEIEILLKEAPEGEDGRSSDEEVSPQAEELMSEPTSLPSQTAKSPQEADSLPSRDIPPIITYPEFLIHSQKPPPLITAQRLLTATYVVSGAAALTYGTSKYIVDPMIESLNSARHSFFETAAENLDTLNEKLEGVVSKVPDKHELMRDSDDDDQELEASSFFNRSAGTQTSPDLSNASSPSLEDPAQNPPSAAEKQTTQLHDLEEELKDLLNPAHMDSEGLEPSKLVKKKLDDFQRYLDGLRYGSSENIFSFAGNKGMEDGIARVKAEIRQTKGALLSSKNFPASMGTKGWGVT